MGPKIFLIGETKIVQAGLSDYLAHIKADWPDNAQQAASDIETLAEVYGRSCYMSFPKFGGGYVNPNVTRHRRTNREYLAHIIESGDGSVLEHVWANFMICDVSRVFTHQLVRHRVGVAISQESFRYVQIGRERGIGSPECLAEYWSEIERAYDCTLQVYESILRAIAAKYGKQSFDELPFAIKKKFSSAARYVLSEGTLTNIGWSCNMRALRHIIEMRTHPGADWEIRLVFGRIAEIAMQQWPNLFADYVVEIDDGLPWFRAMNEKV